MRTRIGGGDDVGTESAWDGLPYRFVVGVVAVSGDRSALSSELWLK